MVRSSVFLLACILPAAGAAQGEYDAPPRSASLSIEGGMAIPAGQWSTIRFARAIELFGRGPVVRGEIQFPAGHSWDIAIQGMYVWFDVSDWEDAAARRGDPISADAQMSTLGILAKPYFELSSEDIIAFEFGAHIVWPSGREILGTGIFEYDFLRSPAFGGSAGLAYERRLTPAFALSFRGSVFVVHDGAEYADGARETIFLWPVTAGIRLFFGRGN